MKTAEGNNKATSSIIIISYDNTCVIPKNVLFWSSCQERRYSPGSNDILLCQINSCNDLNPQHSGFMLRKTDNRSIQVLLQKSVKGIMLSLTIKQCNKTLGIGHFISRYTRQNRTQLPLYKLELLCALVCNRGFSLFQLFNIIILPL